MKDDVLCLNLNAPNIPDTPSAAASCHVASRCDLGQAPFTTRLQEVEDLARLSSKDS